MRSVCLYFQVHQPFRLKTYRFFDIGSDHHYYDEYQNRTIIRRVAQKSYLPANKVLLETIKELGEDFRVSFSISGIAFDQFEMYAPEVLDSFRELAATGQVEFLCETDGHSLAALRNEEEFIAQVNTHREKVKFYFNQDPVSFRNTELVYSDKIGALVHDLGFKVMLTEGAKHILGWKSPNYMYCNAINPKLKVMLRNFPLSDDIAFRFSQKSWSEWPLTPAKFSEWLGRVDPKENIVNLFMDYETFGEHQWEETGILRFLRQMPGKVLKDTDFRFRTPSQLAESVPAVSAIHVPNAVSWADEERDLTAWLGNELQDEAFGKLYSLAEKMQDCANVQLLNDWRYLQTSDHFYYMCTKWFSDGEVHKYFNPYPSPYEAFINYMNVLADFNGRVDEYASSRRRHSRMEDRLSKADQAEAGPDIWESLASIPKIYLKKAMKEVDGRTLSIALHEAPNEIKERLVSCLGRRTLNDYVSFRPSSSDLEPEVIGQARETILNLARKAFEEKD
jgi:alpha-amylase